MCEKIVLQLKIYGFGGLSSTICLKQLSSNHKYLILQNYFQLDDSYAFPKAILHEFMSAKDCLNLIIFTVALFIVCQTTQCIVLAVQGSYLRGNKDPSVLLSTEDKRVAISFLENQILNLNQYHKDAT